MKLRLYIDGSALVADHFSGVGHYTQGMVVALDAWLQSHPEVEAYLVVPYKRVDRLGKYNFQNIKPRRIPLPMRVFRGIVVRKKLPPMDLIYGRGVYFFPDFVTWPLARSKAITTVHDISFDEVPQFVDDNNARFLSATVRNSAKKATYIATVTNTMRDQIAAFYNLPKSKIIVTENAADATHFYKRSDTEIKQVRRKYGIVGNYILSVGNIEPRKNQIGLIRAFMSLPKEIADKYTLLLLGAGGWKNEGLNELVEQALHDGYKIQILQGRVTDEDLPAVYSGARMFAYPSFYEGFGMPLIESMMCGVPVIASNASVMPEVVGKGALLVDPGDDASIAKAIRTIDGMTEKERAGLINRGYEQAEHYSWEHSVENLVDAAMKAMKGA